MTNINPGDLIDVSWEDYPQPSIDLKNPGAMFNVPLVDRGPVLVVAVVPSQRDYDRRMLHYVIASNTMGWAWGSGNWDNASCIKRPT